MYLHRTENGHYTPPCCCFSGELEVVECLPQTFSGGMMTLEDDTLMQWCVDNDFCAEAARAVRYDSDFIWESESWPEGEYIVSEKDRNAEKFPFSIAKDK